MRSPRSPIDHTRPKRFQRNDARIIAAALEVFVANPDAPIAAVARRAGVGISALYRRYASKDALLSHLCRQGLERYIAEAAIAITDERDPWQSFASFMQRIVAASTHTLVVRLAGKFDAAPDLFVLAGEAQALNRRIFDRVNEAGLFREGVVVDDINFVGELLAGLQAGTSERLVELRQRYLQLLLDGLRAEERAALQGQPPNWSDIEPRWRRAAAK